jgi:hypothetical protein
VVILECRRERFSARSERAKEENANKRRPT